MMIYVSRVKKDLKGLAVLMESKERRCDQDGGTGWDSAEGGEKKEAIGGGSSKNDCACR